MPDPRTSQNSRVGATESTAAPSAAAPSAAAPSATEPSAAADAVEAGVEAADAGQAEGFANRAARRAHGKGRSVPPPASTGKQAGGRGTVQNPRQYGTRRSGG